MIVDAAELQRSLADVESAVTSADAEGLRTAAEGWNLPAGLSHEMSRVASSLISFKPRPRAGKFLVLSGVDKSGKETHSFNQSRLRNVTSVYDHLSTSGLSVLPINLPSYGTLLGDLVGAYLGRGREVAIEGGLGRDPAWVLWSLDRSQYNEGVDGWLAEDPKNIVLAKRWTESHVVYQAEVGVDPRRVLRFEEKIVKQDFTIVLDIPPTEAMMRLRKGPDRDKYEHAKMIEGVRRRYLSLSNVYPFGDVYLVDASRSLEDVNGDIISLVDQILQVGGKG